VPRIKRFHPISHDFVRDREVQELRREFADWMGYVWLEMLSESDRNEGRVKGDKESIARSLAWVSLSERPSRHVRTIVMALSWMVYKGWIKEAEGHYVVCNYAEYHKRREQASSPPSLLPSLPLKDRPLRGLVPRPELTPLELIESWNEICGTEGLSKVEQVTNGRQAKARARIKRYPKSEFWGQVLNGIIQSDYLMGRKRKEGDTWKPDFDWLVRNDENPAKVMEGKYD